MPPSCSELIRSEHDIRKTMRNDLQCLETSNIASIEHNRKGKRVLTVRGFEPATGIPPVLVDFHDSMLFQSVISQKRSNIFEPKHRRSESFCLYFLWSMEFALGFSHEKILKKYFSTFENYRSIIELIVLLVLFSSRKNLVLLGGTPPNLFRLSKPEK